MKLSCLALTFLPVLALAQNSSPVATPAADGNYLQNGNFEKFTSLDNVWDGVDSGGFLAGFQGSSEIIQEGGRVGRTPMAPSVQVADLNGDGLLDIMIADPNGYFRVYFNKGTKTEPKFSQCEFVPLFLRRIPVASSAWCILPKIALYDFSKNGTMDLVVGTYPGQLIYFKNTGTRSVPEWKQPAKMETAYLPTSGDNKLWANVFAPAVYDWNRDGKPDVLVGEGSYSANAVHLLLNQSASSTPKFSEDARDYLAYGDGREQLVPAVVDYNGDGHPDLLVGDRTGAINIYLSATTPWKSGEELKRQDTPVMFGTAKGITVGAEGARCVSPAVGDLNGDGLFDIVVGQPNGRIAVSYNTGTPTAPKFGPLVDLKGEDVFKKDTIRKPANWDTYFGEMDGNFYATTTVVSPEEDPQAAPTESKHVLKFEYLPSQNQIIHKPPTVFPGPPNNKLTDFSGLGPGLSTVPSLRTWLYYESADTAGWRIDSNAILVRQRIETGLLKPNTNYKLTFRVKGHGVKQAGFRFSLAGWLIKGGGGAANFVKGTTYQQFDFTVSPNWNTVNRTINLKFEKDAKNTGVDANIADLNSPDKWAGSGGRIEYRGILEIRASTTPDNTVLYFDDIRLVPQ